MSGTARDTRKHPRHNLEVPVMISDAAKRVRKPIRFASGDAKDRFPGMGLEFIDLSPDDRAAIARLS